MYKPVSATYLDGINPFCLECDSTKLNHNFALVENDQFILKVLYYEKRNDSFADSFEFGRRNHHFWKIFRAILFIKKQYKRYRIYFNYILIFFFQSICTKCKKGNSCGTGFV